MEPIKLTTIDGKSIDTTKLPDIKAEMVEIVENSGIREFAIKNNGCCFVYVAMSNTEAWTTCHILDTEHLQKVTNSFADLIKRATNNKFKVLIIPNETRYTGEEWES